MEEVLNGSVLDESAPTISRKSARITRVEVITRGERRRRWTAEQKREIVAESLGRGLTPADVARRHGIGTGLLYTWRRQLLREATAVTTRAEMRFAAVELAPSLPAPEPAGAMSAARGAAVSGRPEGLIEIMLPSGTLLRVDAVVDGAALRRVLSVLAGG